MVGRETRFGGEDNAMTSGIIIDTSVLDNMIATNPKKIADVVTRNAYRILGNAQMVTPRDPARPPIDITQPVTGALRANVDVTKVDPMGLTQDINYYQEYAVYQELGAPANNMPARPFLTPAVEQGADQFIEDIKKAIEP